MGEQVVEALVRLLRRAEARELAHGEHASAVHRRVDATCVRILAGEPDRRVVRKVGRGVERPHGLARERRERDVALGRQTVGGGPLLVGGGDGGGGHRTSRTRWTSSYPT